MSGGNVPPRKVEMTTITRTPEEIARNYEMHMGFLKDRVEELNELLGLTDATHKATVGYIGNARMGRDGWDYSDCRWYVFLPHPGRVGTDDDVIGGWRKGSLEGVMSARRDLKTLITGVKLAKQIG
ncbi:hypothetical protein THORA_27 [Mycobacterium phage Thora]|uniref:Gp27 n=1 Tax=Mycobacterium phage Thora TaxID=1032894 RepID=G1D9N1_9CAUD|nr:hypothetical protein THORA_27 [Mycobacterium phage Thora]